MSLPKEQAIEHLKKAWQSPNVGKRGPSKATLEKEAARRIYLEKLAEKYENIVDIHLEQAAIPANFAERREVIHQIVGKPVEKVEVEQTTTLKLDC